MFAHEATALHRLFDRPPVRRALETLFNFRSRLHLVRQDQLSARRAQLRALLGLVHRARATLFGRDHDFRRIRTLADFRRLVPLRGPAELWRAYGQLGHTWPGPLGPLVTAHPALGDAHPVRLTRELQNAHHRAMRTALSLVLRASPRMRLFEGRLLWLGDDTRLVPGSGVRADALAAARFPLLCRPVLRTGPGWGSHDSHDPDVLIPALAAQYGDERPSCIVGPDERVLGLLDHLRETRERAWADIGAVLSIRRRPGTSSDALRQRVGSRTRVLDVLLRPEGPIAVEDPRYGELRLLVDHGIYFEFVPSGRTEERDPPRLGLEDVRPGIAYDLVVTSPGGWWACPSGLTVSFDRLSPPLIRVVPGQVPASLPVRVPVTLRSDDPACPPLPRAPHRQSAGSPVTHPERLARIPWSVPVDPG